MKLFGKSEATTLVLGASMLALVGETATAEQVDAANQELETAGIKGAQLVPGATLDELTQKAERVDAAEKAQAAAEKKATDLEEANGKLTDQVAALGKKPGAESTSPVRSDAGKSDIEEAEPNEDQKAIDALPHNQALAGHPIFG